MELTDLKRRLRELKRTEQKIRFGSIPGKTPSLVWEVFFDLRETGRSQARYPLKLLAVMDRETLKSVINEYWSFVYSQLFNESDLPGHINRDAGLLLQWGLPADADAATVKKRFRELAKRYHPDTGGDEQSFIALMEAYQMLMGL